MDKAFWQQIKDGDEIAYKKAFDQYYSLLTAFACKYVSDIDIAKEIAQNAFVKLFEKRGTIDIQTSLKSYLYKIVYHDCLNYQKSKKIITAHHSSYAQECDKEVEYHYFIEQTEQEYKLYQAIEQLPDQCKRIFKLSRLEERKNKEIADELNISIRTVETQISKAIKHLKTSLTSFLTFLY